MSKPNLRTVKPGEAPPPKTPKSISDAVESGSSRDVLASIRKALARKIDDGDVSSNAVASVSKELRELDRLIRQIDAERAEEEAMQSAAGNRNRRSFDSSAI